MPIPSFLEKDKTGEKILRWAKQDKNKRHIEILENMLVERDLTGKICLKFAEQVSKSNRKRLEDIVAKRDETGFLCYYFAKYIPGANILRLRSEVLKKDKTGKWVFSLSRLYNDPKLLKVARQRGYQGEDVAEESTKIQL